MRKRVLQINATLNWGSTGHIANQIASVAQKKGWDCLIAHGSRYISPTTIPSLQVGSRFDDYCHAVKSMFLGMHGLGSIKATNAFIEQIKEYKPEIIHLHNIHGYYINYQVLFEYLNSSNTPVVWTLHDCWAMTGQCTHFDSIGCMKWKIGCGDCPLLNVAYHTFVDRTRENWERKKQCFTSVKNLTVVPVSDWLGSVVQQSYLGQYPIRVIHNGIDLTVFRPLSVNKTDLGLCEDKMVILGVASDWSDKKGLKEFIRLSENPSNQVVIIGVSETLKKTLPNSLTAINRTNNQRELAQLYSVADVFVNPTYEDSFPTVNLEALACGTPVITYRTGGSPEAISSETGWVVEQGDRDGILSVVEKLRARNYNEIERQQRACRQRAELLYDKNQCFEGYVALYEQMTH